MKLGTILCLSTFIAVALLSIVQLWFEAFPSELFLKLQITLGVVFVVSLGTMLATREYAETQRLRDSGHID